MSEGAAKAARWLGYVAFDQIIDARNDAPVIHRQAEPTPGIRIAPGQVEVIVPGFDELKPEVLVSGADVRQRHHLVFFGEKTSLAPVMKPLAEQYQADLYLPAGEISDTMLWQMAQDGADDGRPMVVFTIADCDPAGWQMPVSIGHKLRALRDLHFPDLVFEVRPIALTVEQVVMYGLPSTPLKESEKRAAKWKEMFGVEQTEIDALATLRPELLREVIREDVDPFFDRTLDKRVDDATLEWKIEAQAQLESQIDVKTLQALRENALDRLAEIQPQIDAVNEALWSSVEEIDVALPPLTLPKPRVEGLPTNPLVSSTWPFEEAARALISRKRYLG